MNRCSSMTAAAGEGETGEAETEKGKSAGFRHAGCNAHEFEGLRAGALTRQVDPEIAVNEIHAYAAELPEGIPIGVNEIKARDVKHEAVERIVRKNSTGSCCY